MDVARGAEITVIGFVPDGNGGYRQLEALPETERQKIGRELGQRMGRTLNNYFSAHPEEYKKI